MTIRKHRRPQESAVFSVKYMLRLGSEKQTQIAIAICDIYFDDSIVTICEHIHEEFEFILIREGHLTAVIDDTEYELSPDELLIVNPYSFHSATVKSNERLVYTYMIFGFSLLTGIIRDAEQTVNRMKDGRLSFRSNVLDRKTVEKVKVLFDEIEQLRRKPTLTADLDSAAAIYRFMSILLNEAETDLNKFPLRNLEFIYKVTELIESRYRERFSTADAAAAFGYNESHFCTTFKHSFDESFISYLNNFRINRALTGDSTNLSELARSVGFTDYCHFNRCFKHRMKVTPSEYFGKTK